MDSHRNCIMFTGVIRANLNDLKGFTARRTYERGQTVYCVGDRADELHLIDEGRVKIVRISPEGQQKILHIFQRGDFFGELCICGGQLRTEQAVALERLSVTSFQMQGLLKILRRKPDLVIELMELICARLGESYDQIAILSFDNISRRLARELLRLSASGHTSGENSGAHLSVNLTHEELAQLVGTSREMITTVMNQFRQRGLVEYTRRNIVAYPARIQEFLTK